MDMALVVVVVVILRPLVAHRSSKGAFWWLAGWLGSIYLSLCSYTYIRVFEWMRILGWWCRSVYPGWGIRFAKTYL